MLSRIYTVTTLSGHGFRFLLRFAAGLLSAPLGATPETLSGNIEN
jgi:hypothetical protein